MKALAALLFVLAFTTSTHAAVIWDESVNGELSHSAAAPTILPITVGSNIVHASVGNPGGLARDYVRFIIPDGHVLTAINLLAYAPEDIGFTAINAGVHSFFPTPDTDIFFMAGIHLFHTDVGSDLLELMMTRAVTAEGLGYPEITDPGSYCMVIQQTAVVITTYSMEFVLAGPTSTESATWGRIKALYR